MIPSGFRLIGTHYPLEPLQQGTQFGHVRRLEQVQVYAHGMAARFIVCIPTQRDNKWWFPPHLVAKPLGHLVPIHPGKANVQQNNIRGVGLRFLQGSRPLPGDAGLVAEEAEKNPQ